MELDKADTVCTARHINSPESVHMARVHV